MSGKYRNNVEYMFTVPQPIFVEDTDFIKGVVVPRRDYCDNKKVSVEQAKKELFSELKNLERNWGVPKNVIYKEPRKDFVWQEKSWEYEEFCLSSILRDEEDIIKQRVWFFELEDYVEMLD